MIEVLLWSLLAVGGAAATFIVCLRRGVEKVDHAVMVGCVCASMWVAFIVYLVTTA